MAAKSSEKKEIEPSDRRIWLLVDQDNFELETGARRVIDKLLPEAEQDLGLEIFNGASENVAAAVNMLQQIIANLGAPSLFSARRVIWVRGAAFLDSGIISRGKDVVPLVKELAELVKKGLPEGQYLIITAGSVPAKSPLLTVCQKFGTVTRKEAVKPWNRNSQSVAFVAAELKRSGLQAGRDIAEKIVARVGDDSRQLHQEIIKLATYLGDRKTVAVADIANIISPTRDFFTWDMEDAVTDGNMAASLEIMRRLIFQKEEPIRLVNNLDSHYRNLLILKSAVDQGWIKVPAGRSFGGGGTLPPPMQELCATDRRLMNPYLRNNLLRKAVKFSVKRLIRSRKIILQTRQRLVSGNVPGPLIMENLIIRLCRRE